MQKEYKWVSFFTEGKFVVQEKKAWTSQVFREEKIKYSLVKWVFKIDSIIFDILEDNMEALMAFEGFVSLIKTNLAYKEALLNYESVYNLKKFKFTDISTDSAIFMFRNIVEK